jgi:signal transduction histidine kinase
VIVGLTAAILLARTRIATSHQRRTLVPLYAYGTFAMAFVVFSAQVLPQLGAGPFLVFGLQQLVLSGVPVAFVAGMLGGGFARTQDADELGAWLSTADDARPTLREALSRALGDPTLDLWFWLPDEGRHVDADGAPVAPGGRAVAPVELRGEPVGAIAYDDELIADAGVVERAGRVVAVALDRERLTASLQAEQRALAESRARLAAAGDEERRRIARDLHDGVQSRLVAVALRAGRLAADPVAAPEVVREAHALRTETEATLDELRGLVQGVMPALLVERGLGAATEDLVDRLPVPAELELVATDDGLPEQVETTAYFVVAEAVTNAVKHADASRLHVRVAREGDLLAVEVRDDGRGGAAGLDRLRDRVDAHGGRLLVDSEPGAGTRVRAELPCAS